MINVRDFKKDNGICRLTIPLSSMLEDDLNHDNILKDGIEHITEELLNKSIIDHEKINVLPIYSYYDEGKLVFKEVKHIVYDLYFNDVNIKNWSNIFSYSDIKYQKKCVKNTFLRHMYFDSYNILNQSLISFNTSFLNSGLMYLWLINGENDTEGFKIKIPRYDIKNTRLSSESFSFITYKNNVIEDNMGVYCRYELNNAKNGNKSIFTTKNVFENNDYVVNIKNVSEYIFSELKIHKINNEYYFSFVGGVDYIDETKTLIVKLNEIII